MKVKRVEIQFPIGTNIVGLPQYAVHTITSEEFPRKNRHKGKTIIESKIVTE